MPMPGASQSLPKTSWKINPSFIKYPAAKILQSWHPCVESCDIAMVIKTTQHIKQTTLGLPDAVFFGSKALVAMTSSLDQLLHSLCTETQMLQ